MALVASCDVDQLCDRFVGLRMRQNLLRRAVHRLHPRFRRDSLRCSALSPQSQDENESRVSLLLGSIPSFTLFPGAVVGVEGTMNNRIISVTKLYSVLSSPFFHAGISAERSEKPAVDPRFRNDFAVGGARPVLLPRRRRFRASQDVARAGQARKAVSPASCGILRFDSSQCGPFVPDSASSVLDLSSAAFAASLWKELRSVDIPAVLVPSIDDSLAFPAFPQSPYEDSAIPKTAGNPCVLSVGGVRIGVSNCDVLMDLMKSCYWKCVRSGDAM